MLRRFERLSQIVVGLLFALFASQAAAQPLTPAELIDKSSLSVQIEHMPASLKQGLAQSVAQGAPIPPEQVQAISNAYDQAFAPSRVRALLTSRLDGQLSVSERSRIEAFLDSDLGKQLTEAEIAAASPETYVHVEKNARELMADLGQNSHRLALFKSLDRATGSTELGTSVAIGGILAMNYALLAQTPPAPGKPSFEEVREHVEQSRFQITAQIAEMSLVGAAYTYRNVSEDDLQRYLDFANSPSGQAYFQKVGKSFGDVMIDCAGDVGGHLATGKAQKL